MRPAALDGPPAPRLIQYLIGYFNAISLGRGNSGYGPLPLSDHDILAWSILSKTAIEPWEYRVIRMLDSAFLSTYYEARKKNKGDS